MVLIHNDQRYYIPCYEYGGVLLILTHGFTLQACANYLY